MLISVITCSGRELAFLEVEPSWCLDRILAGVPEQPGAMRDCQRRLFYGGKELHFHTTLADIGVESGAQLTLVVIQPLRAVLGCSGGVVTVWSASLGECLHKLIGHQQSVLSTAFSPDGLQILTGSYDCTAKIWSVASAECLQTLRGHEEYVKSAAFSHDGQRVLTASQDGDAKIWCPALGTCLLTLSGHAGGLLCAEFSPDDQKVVTSSHDRTAKIWSTASGECLGTLDGHGKTMLCASFSPDGERVLTGCQEGAVKVWSAASGECLRPLLLGTDAGPVLSATFSPDAQNVLITSHLGMAKICPAASGETERVLHGHSQSVWCAAFSPDGRQVLTASSDRTAKLWSFASGVCECTLEGHTDSVHSAIYSPDGKQVLTASYDQTARIWCTSGKCLAVLSAGSPVISAAFSLNGCFGQRSPAQSLDDVQSVPATSEACQDPEEKLPQVEPQMKTQDAGVLGGPQDEGRRGLAQLREAEQQDGQIAEEIIQEIPTATNAPGLHQKCSITTCIIC